MIFIWLMACGDGTPSSSQGPQNQPLGPGEQPVQEAGQPQSDGPPPTPTEAERPVPAEERTGENGQIAMSESLECESPRSGSAPLLELKKNTLPSQESDSWRSIDSEDPFGHENGAIAVLDFNNDGWDDIVTAMATGIFSYSNNGRGGFEMRTDWFAGIETENITGLAAGDYDNDGLTDLYITQFMASDILLHNTGEAFKAVELGISTAKSISGGASWMDIDADGDLDIFVSSHGAGPEGEFTDKPKLAKADKNQLYEFTGSKFRSLTSKLSYGGSEPYTFNGLWVPLDDKPGFDLYLVNDFGAFVTPNLVLSNQGSFKPLENTGLELEMYGTSGSVSDWNSDGIPDILVSGIGAPALLISDNGKWSDKAAEMGIPKDPNRTTSWGAAVVDMDNDGDDDIWMATGPIFFPENDGSFPNAGKQTDGLFIYENGQFSEASWAPKEAKNSRSAVAADLNRDGFWDVVVNPIDGPVEVYWGSCDDSGFVDIRLEDSKGNKAGLGATVTVKSGDTTWTRWMTSGFGFGSSGPNELHFGLGARSKVDSISVTWADGEQSVFVDIPSKRKLTISR